MIVELYNQITFSLMVTALVLHLVAVLELPFRFFAKGWVFKQAETSAMTSKIVCLGSGIFGSGVAKFAVPTSWLDVFLLWFLFFWMLGMVFGYIVMIVSRGKQWPAPSELITTFIRRPGEPFLRYEKHVSSLVFGWAPTVLFAVWLGWALLNV